MADTESLGASGTIVEELRQIIAFVEVATGLPSRWNGSLLVLAEGTDEAWTAQALPRVSSLAKKEWNCSITVAESVLQDNRRWRTLLHESLHSVSVDLTEPECQRFALWEEAVVESLQRLYRPLLFQHFKIFWSRCCGCLCRIAPPLHSLGAVNPLISIGSSVCTLRQAVFSGDRKRGFIE